MPRWIGAPMPDPDDDFIGEGVSIFQVPGYSSMTIGLVVIEA
ncbi:hypothetical protein [Deinococcus arboris]|nr:hypothetical protein [Deinococcus arboris]